MLGNGGERAKVPSLVRFAFLFRQSENMAFSVCARAPVANAHLLLSWESLGPFLPLAETPPWLILVIGDPEWEDMYREKSVVLSYVSNSGQVL